MDASSTESSQGLCNEINLIMNFKTQKSFSLFRICMMLLFNSPEAIVIRDNPISCGILVKYKVSSPPPLNYGCPLDPQSFVRSAFQMFQRLLFVSRLMCSAGGVLGHTTKMSRTEHKRHCTHPSFGPDKPRALCLCPVPSPLLHS